MGEWVGYSGRAKIEGYDTAGTFIVPVVVLAAIEYFRPVAGSEPQTGEPIQCRVLAGVGGMPSSGSESFIIEVVLPAGVTLEQQRAPVCTLQLADSGNERDVTSEPQAACRLSLLPATTSGTSRISLGTRNVPQRHIFTFYFWIRSTTDLYNSPLRAICSTSLGELRPDVSLSTSSVPAPLPSAGDIVSLAYDFGPLTKINVRRFDGTNERSIVSGAATGEWYGQPIWSHDGKSIAYLKLDGGHFAPWVMNSDGSSPHRFINSGPLSANTAECSTPRFSRDGRTALLTCHTPPTPNWNVWTTDSSGNNQVQRTYGGNALWPAWIASDRYAFIVNQAIIAKVSVDESYHEEFSLGNAWKRSHLASHPSHNILAFTAEPQFGFETEIHLWDNIKGERKLCDGHSPTFSRDGAWIAFIKRVHISSGSWRDSLFRIDLTGKRETEIVQTSILTADWSLR